MTLRHRSLGSADRNGGNLTTTAASTVFANGTTISARFVALYDQGLVAPPLDLPLSSLPREVNVTLNEYGASWGDLSGTLQRLVLWDSGYVISNRSQIIRVYVECGLSMDDSVVSRNQFESQRCAGRECDNVHLSAGACPYATLSRFAKCAVDETPGTSASKEIVVWSEETPNSDIPRPTVFKVSNRSYSIHMQVNGASDPSESCPTRLRLAIPCVVFDNDSKWCLPKPSGAVGKVLEAHRSTSLRSSENSAMMMPLLWVSVVLLSILAGTTFILLRRKLRDLTTAAAESMTEGKEQRNHPAATMTSENELDFTFLQAQEKEKHASGRRRQFRTLSRLSSMLSRSDSNASSSFTDLLNASEVLIAFQNDPVILQKRIPMLDIEFARRMCNGASGDVFLGRVGDQRVAIKQLLKLKRNEIDDVESFAREIQLTSTLDHPNVIRMIGVAWDTFQNLALVLEYRSGGDLLNAIRKRGSRWTWNAEKLSIAIGIARAIVYLHSRVHPLVHRDIKSRNVLVDAATMEPALCDFGSSRNVSALDLISTDPAGTILWSAPEVICSQDYSVKADIFSFGVVLAELDTCTLPYTEERDSDGRPIQAIRIAHMVVENQVKPRLSDLCPRFIRELVMMCVQHKPERRPTAEQVLAKLTEASNDCAALWKSRTYTV